MLIKQFIHISYKPLASVITLNNPIRVKKVLRYLVAILLILVTVVYPGSIKNPFLD
jgi:hypothetical protein